MHNDVVMLSTADWDNPFWTNKQHVAVELARRGYRIFYVESVGLRRPSASAQDIRRIAKRIFKALQPPRQVRPHLWVWSPAVIPLHRNTIARWINRALLSLGLKFWLGMLGIRRKVLWTYNPMTSQLLSLASFETIIYHCVDDVKVQPGMPREEIERSESELVSRANFCFVTSEYLLESCRKLNAQTYYFPNVADFTHFSKALDPSIALPADLAEVSRPIIGFVGAISAYKLDFELLKKLAQGNPEWSVVLIGKVGEGDPQTDIGELRLISNLHFVGPRRYEDLPAYLKAFSVAILPNVLNEYTRSMFPMKFLEYLAAGKPVVATNLPALQAFRKFTWLAKDTDGFIAAIAAALRGEGASLEARLELAKGQTYELRTERMLQLLRGAGGFDGISIDREKILQ